MYGHDKYLENVGTYTQGNTRLEVQWREGEKPFSDSLFQRKGWLQVPGMVALDKMSKCGRQNIKWSKSENAPWEK